MAASYIFGLTAADVAEEVNGVDDSSIGVSTEPVSTANLLVWINDGASRFNSILTKAGITPDANMDADAHQAVATGIKAYAVHKTLLRLGHTGPSLDASEKEWLSIYAEYSNQPQQLGGAYEDVLVVAVDSVVTANVNDGFFTGSTTTDMDW